MVSKLSHIVEDMCILTLKSDVLEVMLVRTYVGCMYGIFSRYYEYFIISYIFCS